MRSSGSRVDIAQKPNKSGQILDQRWKLFFGTFTKLIPRKIFILYCKTFGVDGTLKILFLCICNRHDIRVIFKMICLCCAALSKLQDTGSVCIC